MLARIGIRLGMSLVGIAVGLALSAKLLNHMSISTTGLVEATILFWIVHLLVDFVALRVLIRNPSVAVAGLLALLSTVISLAIVTAIVDGMHIKGASTYLIATLIIWITTAGADIWGHRMIRARRRLG
jgi:hypothetical protein